MEKIVTEPAKWVPKGWGGELWIANLPGEYCGKILYFTKGKKLSYHYHIEKREHFWLSSGKLILKYSWEDDLEKAEETILFPGMHFEIPRGLRHQMIALEDSVLIEFSTFHKDEDSIRIVKGDQGQI